MARVRYRRGWLITAIILALFGLVTIGQGGAVLLDIGGQREAMGHIVPLVLKLNVAAGCLYVAAAIGMMMHKTWPQYVLLLALALMLYAAFFLYAHIQHHGAYEQRTVMALTFRVFATGLFYFAARYFSKALSTEQVQR